MFEPFQFPPFVVFVEEHISDSNRYVYDSLNTRKERRRASSRHIEFGLTQRPFRHLGGSQDTIPGRRGVGGRWSFHPPLNYHSSGAGHQRRNTSHFSSLGTFLRKKRNPPLLQIPFRYFDGAEKGTRTPTGFPTTTSNRLRPGDALESFGELPIMPLSSDDALFQVARGVRDRFSCPLPRPRKPPI